MRRRYPGEPHDGEELLRMANAGDVYAIALIESARPPRRECCVCHETTRPGSEPASHGVGRCCWDEYRAKQGLAPKPYPEEE